MNNDEKIAFDYISSLGYSSIDYEPHVNVPPDFLIDNKIAVEVRRLNQQKLVNGKYHGLEDMHFKLVQKFTKILKEYETDEYDHTIIVSLSYGRPLKLDSRLFKQIKEEIQTHIPLLKKELSIQVHDNLEIRLWKSELKLNKSIILGTALDYDSGGFVVSEIYKNLKLIVVEKEEKINKYYDNYKEWWLVLVDYIGYGLDEIDVKQLNSLPNLNTIFDKVVLVSPLDIKRTVEIEIEPSLQ